MSRDCQHGRQTGKCSECDVEELEHENRLLRARNERLERETAIAIGPFFLKRYDDDSLWLGHESGEGMQVRNHRVLEVFNELWKEF